MDSKSASPMVSRVDQSQYRHLNHIFCAIWNEPTGLSQRPLSMASYEFTQGVSIAVSVKPRQQTLIEFVFETGVLSSICAATVLLQKSRHQSRSYFAKSGFERIKFGAAHGADSNSEVG